MKSSVYPGLDVKLRTDGKDIDEHAVDEVIAEEDATRTTITCHVQAIPDANFSIEFAFDSTYGFHDDDIVANIFLDGVLAHRPVLSPLNGVQQTHSVTGVTKYLDGQWQQCKFAFASLITNEEKPDIALKDKLAHLGEVTVELIACKTVGSRYPTTAHSVGKFEAAVDSVIPEKALKGRAISTHVALSKPTPTSPQNIIHVDYPWGTKPFATFTFNYGTRKDLQSKGIIPEDVPLAERDINTLSVDEMRQLLQEQSAQLQDRVRVKKEKRDWSDFQESELENDGDEVEVIADEAVGKRRKERHDLEIEVIDLSTD